MVNLSHRKVGGIHFIKLGRLTISWSLKRKPWRPTDRQYERMMEACHVIPERRMALAVRRLNRAGV